MRSGIQSGFTLIELVITMVISTIVVGFVSVFISGPIVGFTDQARRVKLVDAAQASLGRMTRDVRRALPNSIRIANSVSGPALELLSNRRWYPVSAPAAGQREPNSGFLQPGYCVRDHWSIYSNHETLYVHKP